MIRFSSAACLVLLSISNIYGQSKFEPGYVTTSTGDTIRGMIDYRNWSQNPKAIRFRDDKTQTNKSLGIHDLSGFQVHGESYERAVVSLNTTAINNNDLPEISLPELATDTVFLLKLADGTKSLYYLRDHTDKVQLYFGKEHELLIFHKYKIIKENQTRIATVDRYRQQVKAYLDNCPEISGRITNLRYSNKEILELFSLYYNKCSAATPRLISRREGLGFEKGVIAGITSAKLSFTGYNFPYLTDYKHKMSTRPTAGLFLNIVIPRTRKHLLIANELSYASYKISGQSRTDINPENFTTTDFTLALGHVKLNNLVRYKVLRQNAFFYVNAGISNGFLISEKNHYLARTQFYADVHVKETEALETRKHEQGFLVGIGGGVRKLGFEVRFENGNGNSNYSSITSSVKRYSLLAHYRF
jgi:hypothetical protein